jgi:hypothetical protein
MHRKTGSLLRMPDEVNPTIQCECGCGIAFDLYDEAGRPRRFVPGHNPQLAPSKEAVVAYVRLNGTTSAKTIATALGKSVEAVHQTLWKLRRSGVLPWARAPKPANAIISCACGCGQLFLKYDPHGRPRQYVSGHNRTRRK